MNNSEREVDAVRAMLDALRAEIGVLTRTAEVLTDHNVRLRSFLLRTLDPEDLGHACSAEVRAEAKQLLFMRQANGMGCPPCTHDCQQGPMCPARRLQAGA